VISLDKNTILVRRDLLNISRIIGGKMVLEQTRIDLAALVEAAVFGIDATRLQSQAAFTPHGELAGTRVLVVGAGATTTIATNAAAALARD
jgi:hypothetical protein